MTIKVAHLVHDFCPNGNEFIYRFTTNPSVNNSVFCGYRSEKDQYPHDKVIIYKNSLRLLTALSCLNADLAQRAYLAVRRREWRNFLRTFTPDVIHVQFGTTLIDHCDMLAQTEIPIVCTFHGSDINSATYNPQYHSQLLNSFSLLRKAHFVSRDLRDQATVLGFEPSKASVIHLGTFLSDQQRQPRTDRSFVQLCCVGRMVPCKGHETLLRAIQWLTRRNVHIQLDFIGDGPLRHRLEWLTRVLGLTKMIRFRGVVKHQETLQSIRESDIVVLASQVADDGQAEGIPVVLMEAGACGVPVVSTYCGGIEELIEHGETGVLVAQRDPEGLGIAIQRLAEDYELRTEMGKKAIRRIRSHFNATNCLREVTQWYADLLDDV